MSTPGSVFGARRKKPEKDGDQPPDWRVRNRLAVDRAAAEKRAREDEAEDWIAKVRARGRPVGP